MAKRRRLLDWQRHNRRKMLKRRMDQRKTNFRLEQLEDALRTSYQTSFVTRPMIKAMARGLLAGNLYEIDMNRRLALFTVADDCFDPSRPIEPIVI